MRVEAALRDADLQRQRLDGDRSQAVLGEDVDGGLTPMSGTPQIGYLETSPAAGRRIDVQFVKGPAEAKSEGAAAETKLDGFQATVLGNVVAFTPQRPGRRQRRRPRGAATAVEAVKFSSQRPGRGHRRRR